MPEFVPLFDAMRTAQAATPAPAVSALIAQEQPSAASARDGAGDRIGDVRRAEAFEAALRDLLREIAAEVLGRELALAPCDVDAVVARLCRRYALDPSRVRVATSGGDVAIECDGGWIDASLGRRLEAVLERIE